jgi:hypothetical protein
MVKKIAMFCVIVLILLSSLNIFVLAAKDEGSLEKNYSNQIDREKKESNKLIDSVTSNSDEAIKKNKESFDFKKNSNTSKASDQKSADSLSKSTYGFATTILYEVKRFSLPVCALLIIAGAMIYFILGPRNMARKKFGLMLMFGAFTFWTIAQIAPVVLGIIIQQQ